MKQCLLMFALLFSSVGLCSGKVSFNPSVSMQTKDLLMSGGLSIYESVPFLPVHYVAFVGLSERLSDNMLSKIGFASMVHEFEMSLGNRFSVGSGLTMSYEMNQDVWRNDIHAKVAYQLW